jgi:hypothetical protein
MIARSLSAVVLALLLLAGCSDGVTGTYADKVGFMSFRFDGHGGVVQNTLGLEIEMTYRVADDEITVVGPHAEMVLRRLPDGALEGPDGMRLVSAPEQAAR